MQGELRRLCLRIEEDKLDTEDSYKVIIAKLEEAGFSRTSKKKMGQEMRKYFKLRMQPQQTLYEFLIQEENQAEEVKTIGLTLQDEVRGLHVLEWLRVSEEIKSLLRMELVDDIKLSKLKPKLYNMFSSDQKGTHAPGKVFWEDAEDGGDGPDDDDDEPNDEEAYLAGDKSGSETASED